MTMLSSYTTLRDMFYLCLISIYALSDTCHAANQEKINIPGIGVVDYQEIFKETSIPGENMDAFAARIGARLRAFSNSTGFEACGVIASDNDGNFGVIIGSNLSHIACANFKNKVPEMMFPTGETIHSHGSTSAFNANRNDKLLSPGTFDGITRGVFKKVESQKLDAFSPTDYGGGSGYLATPGGVIHQNGVGTVRVVGLPH